MSLKNFIVLMLSVSLVIGAVLTGGCVGNETTTPETPIRIIEDITPQEAFTLIQNNRNNPDFVIIDVRTPEEFGEGHIENAINMDFYSRTFRDEINNLDKSKKYLIYCRSDNRSGNALDIMAELNFREVYNILGGIIDWKAESLPITE
ncbi:rhodanese-like domain-containing protein [Chloroflexota bacterium]